MPSTVIRHSWHASTIQQMHEYWQGHAAVRALLVVGSVAQDAADRWSDLDLLVVGDDGHAEEFFPSVPWLRMLGPIFAYEQHQGQDRSVTRVCLVDGRRVDCIIMTESAFAAAKDLPLLGGVHVCFSRSALVNRRLAQQAIAPGFQPLAPQAFEQLVNRFWFKAVVSITKVVCNDLLIAVHLCQDVLQELCVLAMVLRDRAAGTMIHKTGGIGNDFVRRVPMLHNPASAHHVLDCLEQASVVFDELAQQWSLMYQARHDIFARWIAQARATLTQQ